MEVLYPRCAGLEVHQQTVVACVRIASGSTVQQDVRTFSTATGALLALADWLTAHECTHVAMESTGVSWKPIWHVLAGRFELVLANALQIRSVPGRKSDVNDAIWIADPESPRGCQPEPYPREVRRRGGGKKTGWTKPLPSAALWGSAEVPSESRHVVHIRPLRQRRQIPDLYALEHALSKWSHRRSSGQRPGPFQARAAERIEDRRSHRRQIQMRG